MNAELILSLIKLEKEGPYWDFKEKHTDNIVDLVHDIICMANNLEFVDGYLIYGVSNKFDILGLTETELLKQVDLNNKLKAVKFAGDYRPNVVIEQVQVEDKVLDVIVVKASYNTPFILSIDYGKKQEDKGRVIKANHIYTRNNDSNTDINKSADIHQVEKLWARRFRLYETPLSQVQYYLEESKNWENSPYDSINEIFYNINRPEFTIEKVEDARNSASVFYIMNQIDTSPNWYTIYLKYHQTTLYSVQGISLDGGRAFVPVPDNQCI